MASVKSLATRMADEGLQSYVVTYIEHEGTEEMVMQFWADDEAHAGEQADDAEPFCAILSIELQEAYEARTGKYINNGSES